MYGHLQQPGFCGPPKFRSFAAKIGLLQQNHLQHPFAAKIGHLQQLVRKKIEKIREISKKSTIFESLNVQKKLGYFFET